MHLKCRNPAWQDQRPRAGMGASSGCDTNRCGLSLHLRVCPGDEGPGQAFTPSVQCYGADVGLAIPPLCGAGQGGLSCTPATGAGSGCIAVCSTNQISQCQQSLRTPKHTLGSMACPAAQCEGVSVPVRGP